MLARSPSNKNLSKACSHVGHLDEFVDFYERVETITADGWKLREWLRYEGAAIEDGVYCTSRG